MNNEPTWGIATKLENGYWQLVTCGENGEREVPGNPSGEEPPDRYPWASGPLGFIQALAPDGGVLALMAQGLTDL